MAKKGIINVFMFTALLFTGTMAVIFSSVVKSGIAEGLSVSCNTIVPSMFPFLCIGAVCVNCINEMPMPKFLKKGYEKIFSLPSVTAKCVLIGLLGGYPTGCLMASEMSKSGSITKKQAGRLCLFVVNGGPAFSILAVGENMCKNKTVGFFLFISTLSANLILGIVLGLIAKNEPSKTSDVKLTAKPTATFADSIETSTLACLKICGWTTLFSAVIYVLKHICNSQIAVKVISAVLEVTTGCNENKSSYILTAAILGWGGICVHAQISGFLNSVEVNKSHFILSRIAVSGMSALIMWGLITAFPQSVKVANINGYAVTPTHSGIGITAVLVVLMIIFILDKKKRLFSFNNSKN